MSAASSGSVTSVSAAQPGRAYFCRFLEVCGGVCSLRWILVRWSFIQLPAANLPPCRRSTLRGDLSSTAQRLVSEYHRFYCRKPLGLQILTKKLKFDAPRPWRHCQDP
ncbi:unnamed protein product [Prorocentrum cordatum]|uniref:Uncharacterized protein n=1 Tax=Prorocentrum cordatum TaxID=2364126 RepID=A0ABN9RGJ3_9DINO|nr:unnamed protein product [Polarella glacialis]